MKEEVVKKSNKKGIILGIIIILITIGVGGYLLYNKYYKEEPVKDYDEQALYEKLIKDYGDEITANVISYVAKNSGKIPTWNDINKDMVQSEKINCNVKINYNGTVYLSNCKIKDIEYSSDYTYGSNLKKPIENSGNSKAPVYSDKEIYIYGYTYSDNTSYTISNNKYENDTYHKLFHTYACLKDNCQGYAVSQVTKDTVIYDEDTYYLYNYETENKVRLDLRTDEIYEYINFISSSSKDYGIYIQKREDNKIKFALYNLETNKLITDFIYTNVNTYKIDKLLNDGYFVANAGEELKDIKLYIINNKDGSVYKELNDSSIISEEAGDNIIYVTSTYGGSEGYRLYKNNFELLTGLNNYYMYAINSDNTITVFDVNNKNIFYIYNTNGELLYTSKNYHEIVKVVKDYIVILDEENNLKLLDLKENEKTTFLKVTDKYKLHPMISGWFTENGKNGIYFVVENKDIKYGTKGSGLEYYYIPTTGETGIIETIGVGGYAKPVMYLYPTKKTKVTVSFTKPYLLTTTYPKYNNDWTFTVYPNGDMYDKNNKYYYGLYWEEIGSSKISFNEGFYVTKDKAISFLERTTDELGFTRREANEFIMYWLKILENNEKSLVYYELTEERNQYNGLIINPKPDSILRVAIHVKKVNEPVKIKEQKLTKFKRQGFTVVEWGGAEH